MSMLKQGFAVDSTPCDQNVIYRYIAKCTPIDIILYHSFNINLWFYMHIIIYRSFQ